MTRRCAGVALSAVVGLVTLAGCGDGSSGDGSRAGDSSSGGIDRGEVVAQMVERFGITEEQAACGVDRLDEAVVAAFVAADYDLGALDRAEAAAVYQAGVDCVGEP